MKKLILNGIIALLTIIVLSACFNIYFGIGYVFLLLSHEVGHWYAAKMLKVHVKFGGFTPAGSYIEHETLNSCKDNAYIALGGPLLGTVAAILCYIFFLLFNNDTFLALSFLGLILNLANLIPCYPMDGGHIAESISPWIMLIGIPIFLFSIIGSRNFIFLLIVFIIGLLQTLNTLITYKDEEKRYFEIDKNTRRRIAVQYIALLTFLALSVFYIQYSSNMPAVFKELSRF
jgi:Zn-dependent protease